MKSSIVVSLLVIVMVSSKNNDNLDSKCTAATETGYSSIYFCSSDLWSRYRDGDCFLGQRRPGPRHEHLPRRGADVDSLLQGGDGCRRVVPGTRVPRRRGSLWTPGMRQREEIHVQVSVNDAELAH
jgi:hypothetical protein